MTGYGETLPLLEQAFFLERSVDFDAVEAANHGAIDIGDGDALGAGFRDDFLHGTVVLFDVPDDKRHAEVLEILFLGFAKGAPLRAVECHGCCVVHVFFPLI